VKHLAARAEEQPVLAVLNQQAVGLALSQEAARTRSQLNSTVVVAVLGIGLEAAKGWVDSSFSVVLRLLLVAVVKVMPFGQREEVVSQRTAAVELHSGKAS
jgi:hypothetical protein